ncbi:MAG TPA: DNA ligase D [Candidatus Nitrosopolaris sp.]|nr:DNA ligase D [Candidatus Nitrosopolaris sp.]
MSSLQEYHKKRNFGDTPEPRGTNTQRRGITRNKQRGKSDSLRFVVQKHQATRLHYDFRLEAKDGTLKSWAVPKGIALDPKTKRLANMTEDHPLDYLLFEGVIPAGSYGAGTVIVWDKGIYTTERDLSEQLQAGKISFVLFGQKLRGRFALVKIRRGKESNKEDNHWLLIKENDEYSSPDLDRTSAIPEPVLTKRTIEDLKAVKLEGTNRKQLGRKRKTRNSEEQTEANGKGKSEKELKPNIISHNEFPTTVKPMLATLVDKPFDSKDWVFEIKWDGVRALVFLGKTKQIFELKSRNDKSITHRYPELLSPLEVAIYCRESVILDGEIVVLDDKGYPNFQNHQRRMNVDSPNEIATLAKQIPATYYLFDILYLDGKNVQSLPFVDRRQLLSDVIRPNNKIKISDFVEEKGLEVYKNIKTMNLEGIMAKKKSSMYMQGTRSTDWLKIKIIKTQDCVVIGYTKGEGNRAGYFGSLLLAVYDKTEELVFVGHVGSGFDYSSLDSVYKMLEKMKVDTRPIKYVPYINREPVWIRPELVVEVKFHGWTKDMIMRTPIFVRFREDKPPSECRTEVEALAEVVPNDDVTNHHSSQMRKSNNELSSNVQTFSNIDKIFWNKTKDHRALTKKDVIDYYERMSSYILPHLRDRPVSLSRYPDGASGKHFYHKNWDNKRPEYVEIAKVYSESRGRIISYIVCNNKDTLLWLANLGCIETHPWFSRVKNFDPCKGAEIEEDECGLKHPDFIVFDLDPYIYSGHEAAGEEPQYNTKGFKAVVEVAYLLKDLLAALNIGSYVKTSGKTGLHIFVPILPSYTYDQTRKFAEAIGKSLVSRYPEKITMEWNAVRRKGKVFFDYNQNAKGKTIASIFSARPTPSATVSMPVRWEKLSSIMPIDFNMLNVPGVINRNGDSWKDILKEKQDINKILENVDQIQ